MIYSAIFLLHNIVAILYHPFSIFIVFDSQRSHTHSQISVLSEQPKCEIERLSINILFTDVSIIMSLIFNRQSLRRGIA